MIHDYSNQDTDVPEDGRKVCQPRQVQFLGTIEKFCQFGFVQGVSHYLP